MKNAEYYLRYLVEEIHTTVVATVDDDGLPVTAAIDMMECDADSLYFLTAKGKGFYDRLVKRGLFAVSENIRRTARTLPQDRRRNEHACHYQVPVLADNA